jgi:hypothetical protein
MDDILILAPTRWKLKKAIRVLNLTFIDLKLEKHPDKTMIGRTDRGFDFLGYRFKPERITLAQKTISNFITKALRLYEQEPPHRRRRRLGAYGLRWIRWATSGGVQLWTDNLRFSVLAACELCLSALPPESREGDQPGTQ